AHPPLHSCPTRRSSDLTDDKKQPVCSFEPEQYRGRPLCRLEPLDEITRDCRWSFRVAAKPCNNALELFLQLAPRRCLGHFLCPRSEEHTSELQSRFDLV